nr:hypothetical protein [Tanacetum cinerariifolium]
MVACLSSQPGLSDLSTMFPPPSGNDETMMMMVMGCRDDYYEVVHVARWKVKTKKGGPWTNANLGPIRWHADLGRPSDFTLHAAGSTESSTDNTILGGRVHVYAGASMPEVTLKYTDTILLFFTPKFGPGVTHGARLTRVVSLRVGATPHQWPEISSDTERLPKQEITSTVFLYSHLFDINLIISCLEYTAASTTT